MSDGQSSSLREAKCWTGQVSKRDSHRQTEREVSRRSHVCWKHLTSSTFFSESQIKHESSVRAQRSKCFQLFLKWWESALEIGTSQNSVFPDVPLPWKAPSCLSAQPVFLSVRCCFDPLDGLTATPRGFPPQLQLHLAATSPTHRLFSPFPPLVPLSRPLITNTCGLWFS